MFLVGFDGVFDYPLKGMAERQGFEPWRPCGLPALQAGALNRAMRPLLCNLYNKLRGSRTQNS